MKKKINFTNIAMRAGAVGAGVVVAKVADNPLKEMKPALRGALKIVVGALLPAVVSMPTKAGKVDFVAGIGDGILAAGAADVYDGLINPAESADDDSTLDGIGDQFEETYIDVEDIEEVAGIDDPISGDDNEVISGDEYNIDDEFEGLNE